MKKFLRKQKRTMRELQMTITEQMVRLNNIEGVTNDLKRQFDEMKNCLSLQKFASFSNIAGM